ncbi:hypothetical protein A5664_17060 [Mycolicibacterium fortuitum]|uniref:hypothetical protein n=1 Tax=Mycolicibacterium fortuitum TaxID=1766 RepID=UPI0007ED55DF|nr:hypothetical protein [Mycolicibacterium fortuitum]OBI78913.1 hypothetical protein A5664_17060 [Mycolicibacterium fortuitum]
MNMPTLTRKRATAVRPNDQPSRTEAVYSQAELRERRRAGLSTVYGGAFSLADEMSAAVHPLAYRVSTLPNPQVCAGRVADLADAAHELVSTVTGWLAELDARARTEHLAHDTAKRTAAVRLLVDLAQRPVLPEIGAEQVASGSWAAALVEMAQPYTGPLSDLLARSRPPGDSELRGLASRSERLCDLLRELDTATRQLQIRIGKAEGAARRRPTQQSRADAARSQLRDLGVNIP